MTLDIFVEGCDDSFSCRYSGFGYFRWQIFRGWNLELGKLYEKKFGFLWDKNDGTSGFNFGILNLLLFRGKFGSSEDGESKINQILDEYDKPYNEGFKLLYHHSDCDGEITPDECVILLKSFGRVDPENFDKSDKDDYEFVVEGFDIWKKMMTYAIENNKSILFG